MQVTFIISDSNSRKKVNNKHLLNVYYVAGAEPLYKLFSQHPPSPSWG